MCTVISTLRWAVLTVLWIGFCHTGPMSQCIDLFVFICVYFVCFCFLLHICCIIVSMVGWTWWDWSMCMYDVDCEQIYVAGITGNRLEKVRKIINRGGGTRWMHLFVAWSILLNTHVHEQTILIAARWCLSFFLHVFWKWYFTISSTGFYGADALHLIQPTVTKLWRELRTRTYLILSWFIVICRLYVCVCCH